MSHADHSGEPDRSELETALLDVRAAFRLLQRYQRRVLDLVDEVASELGNELRFRYWYPANYSSTPRATWPPVKHWAWDGLPYYDFCAVYYRDEFSVEEHRPGDWLVVIRVSADTGFEFGDGEPDPTGFIAPDSAASQLTVYRYRSIHPNRKQWRSIERIREKWPVASASQDMTVDHLSIPLADLANPQQIAQFAKRVKEELILPV